MQRSGRRHFDAFSVCEEGGELQDVDEQEHSSARMRISLSNKMNCYFSSFWRRSKQKSILITNQASYKRMNVTFTAAVQQHQQWIMKNVTVFF